LGTGKLREMILVGSHDYESSWKLNINNYENKNKIIRIVNE